MRSDTPATTAQEAWYKDWFNSPYYDILYKHRDEQEAQRFIDRLLVWLQPAPGARMLDLACGKGRFAVYLARKGFDVTGLDLSENSITFARQSESPNLSFFTHDMRLPFRINYFDHTFSFFTSFGYFEHEKDDLRTLKSIRAGLRKGGTFVLDFFNSAYVTRYLLGEERKEIGGMTFHIHKWVDKQRVNKQISFEAEGRQWQYQESVRLFTLDDFERLFARSGLEIAETFGDYTLQPFRPADSPRLIIVARK